MICNMCAHSVTELRSFRECLSKAESNRPIGKRVAKSTEEKNDSDSKHTKLHLMFKIRNFSNIAPC